MRELIKKAVPIAAMLAVLMASGAATLRAQIVINGGFESGNAGWSYSPGTIGIGGGECVPPGSGLPSDDPSATGATSWTTGAYPHSGSQEMWFGAMRCTPSISQILSTSPGQSYNLTFWVMANPNYGNNFPNFFQVWIDNSILFTSPLGGFTNNSYEQYSMAFNSGEVGNNTLTFYGDNINGSTLLDDVGVASVTPEPASLALLATGLIGLAGVMRRRRKTQA